MADRTLVYVVHWLESPGIYKVGKHTGTRDKIISRYRDKGDPEVILAYATEHAAQVERAFHRAMEDKRIVRRSFDSKGTLTEVYKMPLSDLLVAMADIIRRDEAGEFTAEPALAPTTAMLPTAGTKYGATFPDGPTFNEVCTAIATGQQTVVKVMTVLRKVLAYIEDTKSFVINEGAYRTIKPDELYTMITNIAIELPEESAVATARPGGLIWSITSLSRSFLNLRITPTKVPLRQIIDDHLYVISYKRAVFHVYPPSEKSAPNMAIFNMFAGMPTVNDSAAQPSSSVFAYIHQAGGPYLINWLAHAMQRPHENRPPLVVNGSYAGTFANFVQQLYGPRIQLLDIWVNPKSTIEEMRANAAATKKSILIFPANDPDFGLIANDFGYAMIWPKTAANFNTAELYNYLAKLPIGDIKVPAELRPKKRNAFDYWCIALERKIIKKPAASTVNTLYDFYCEFTTTNKLEPGTNAEFTRRMRNLGYKINGNIISNWSLRYINLHSRSLGDMAASCNKLT